jgi:pyruvate ferredoxin oxidoreductase alpha subunit
MNEMLYFASGLRLPIVMATMSRGLSAPITLWTDHVDFLSQRDTGWIMFHAKNNQEVFDTILQAYRLAEDNKVLLPVMVNMEGYVLSYTKEPVTLPAQGKVDRFVKKYKPRHAFFDPKTPLIQGSAAMSEEYTFFKAQQHLAQKNALIKSKEIFKKFKKEFGRSYGVIEECYTKDAELLLISQGSMSTTVEATIKKAREKGKKVGLLRLRMIRPFPKKEIKKALEGKKALAVLDRNIAPGAGGMMYPEIAACLHEMGSSAVLSSFILGLGGVPQTMEKIAKVIEKLEKD